MARKVGSSGPFNSPADVGGSNAPGDADQGGQTLVGLDINPPGEAGELDPDDPEAMGRRYRSDTQLLSVVQNELDSSLGWTGTRLAETRRVGLNNYFANSRGDEREGRSTVVTREVFEAVEQVMPDMIEIFASSNEVARFMPRKAEDVEGAEQATDACNYVFNESDGFMVLYTMFKDAFIQKNGVVKVWTEESAEWTVENYEGKTLLEFFEILEEEDLQVMAVTAFTDNNGEREEIDLSVLLGPEGAQYDALGVFFDASCRRMVADGKIRLDNIPPEEFVINRDARGLDDPTTRFVAHRVRTSASALIAQGYDPDLIRTIPSSQSVYTTDQDAVVRSSQDDSFPQVWSYRQDEERTIYITECYVRVDMDGDGISEWHKVVVGGDYGQVLMSADQVNYHPFASVTPIPIPHRFYGLSFSDVTDDLQQINTTLWRQFLDSIYLANDPRVIVRSTGSYESATPLCNLDQLLNSEVGGYIEEYGENAIRPFPTVTNSQHILPAFELHEKSLQARIGVSPEAAGVNPDSISKHVFGAMVQSSASARRIAMYARIFANTGVKRIFELIYKELMTHKAAPLMLRLRGKWTPIDPTAWAKDLDCQVNVGLGHGSKIEKSSHIQSILEVQKQIAEAGLTNIVNEEKIYNSAATFTESLGFKDTERYFDDPATVPPVEPQESPEEQAIKAQQEIDVMKVEIERQRLEVERYKAQIEAKKIELDHEVKIYELRLKAGQEAAQAAAPGPQDPGGNGGGAPRGSIPMDDPRFEIPPPMPPMPMQPQGPMPPGMPGQPPQGPQPGSGGLTMEQAGLAPGPEEAAQMQQAFAARQGA